MSWKDIKVGDWIKYDARGYPSNTTNEFWFGRVVDTSELGQSNCHFGVNPYNKSTNVLEVSSIYSWHCDECEKIDPPTEFTEK